MILRSDVHDAFAENVLIVKDDYPLGLVKEADLVAKKYHTPKTKMVGLRSAYQK